MMSFFGRRERSSAMTCSQWTWVRYSVFTCCMLTAMGVLPSPIADQEVVRVWGQAPGADRQAFKVNGTLKGMQNGMLMVTGADKKDYMVKLPKELDKVRYSGQAALEWLSNGLFVRFETQMDEKGRIVGTVKQVEVFVPDPQLQNNPATMKEHVPGVHLLGVAGSDGLFSDEKVPANSVKSYRVIAQLIGVAKNKMMVAAGSNRLQVEVDPNVAINVSVPGMDLCQPGDDIAISGFTYPNQPQFVESQTISVTGKQLIGQKVKKGPKAAASKTATKSRKDKKDGTEADGAKDGAAKPKADDK